MLRLKAVSYLQSRTEGGKMFQILGWAETRNACELKLRSLRGTE